MTRTVKEAAARANTADKVLEDRIKAFERPNHYHLMAHTVESVCDRHFDKEDTSWPDFILPCDCGHHTGLCLTCKRIITYQSPERQYGHDTECEERPDDVGVSF